MPLVVSGLSAGAMWTQTVRGAEAPSPTPLSPAIHRRSAAWQDTMTAKRRISLVRLRGRAVRLEMVNENKQPSHAWIGIRHVTLISR